MAIAKGRQSDNFESEESYSNNYHTPEEFISNLAEELDRSFTDLVNFENDPLYYEENFLSNLELEEGIEARKHEEQKIKASYKERVKLAKTNFESKLEAINQMQKSMKGLYTFFSGESFLVSTILRDDLPNKLEVIKKFIDCQSLIGNSSAKLALFFQYLLEERYTDGKIGILKISSTQKAKFIKAMVDIGVFDLKGRNGQVREIEDIESDMNKKMRLRPDIDSWNNKEQDFHSKIRDIFNP